MPGTKVKTLGALKKLCAKLKARGKKIVFTNGCFDILHFGHVQYLQKAKKLGDLLVVALNSDASVKKIKGKNRPIVNQHDRSQILAGLESVDFVVIFNEVTPLKTIAAIKPNILVKGADWKNKTIVGGEILKPYQGKVKTICFAKGRSTSNIISRIAKLYAK